MSEQKQPAEVGPVELVLGPLPEPAQSASFYRNKNGRCEDAPLLWLLHDLMKTELPTCTERGDM